MFILAYYNEKKELVDHKIGPFDELRKEVEEAINNGSKYKSAVISKIDGRRYTLSALDPEKLEAERLEAERLEAKYQTGSASKKK